jgi:hypothetical protein
MMQFHSPSILTVFSQDPSKCQSYISFAVFSEEIIWWFPHQNSVFIFYISSILSEPFLIDVLEHE